MSTTVKSLLVLLSLSTTSVVLYASDMTYTGPCPYVFQDKPRTNEEVDAQARECLDAERYWEETEARIIRRYRILEYLEKKYGSKCSIIAAIVEQGLKREAVKKILQRSLITALKSELKKEQLQQSRDEELARLSRCVKEYKKEIRQQQKNKRQSRLPAQLSRVKVPVTVPTVRLSVK